MPDYSLFSQNTKHTEPLAARMRPETLDEYIGQEHIVGKGRLLRRAIKTDRLSSIILYGPPGTGKTTLAQVIAHHTKSNFVILNAVLSGVQQIRDTISRAEEQKKLYGKKTILFVDEVHRWNKSQQDALLPWVENGTVVMIGATTENPFFEVNKALVSRSRVFKLEPLSEEELTRVAQAALTDTEKGYGKWKISFEEGGLEHLVKTAAGDARSLLNALELAVETSVENWPPPKGTELFISKEACEESIQQRVVLYDADGDYHYDVISAFIKSIRGSDVDAALYWLALMIQAGEAPHFIFRRMLISACEDIGMANPQAISVVTSCLQAFDAVGLPEGQYHLAHAAIYLATSPKSNSSLGYFDAVKTVREQRTEVPGHLRDPSRDSSLGDGAGYLYPHEYRHHWVAQQYLPDDLVGRIFYKPSQEGYEKEIARGVLQRRETQLSTLLDPSSILGKNHSSLTAQSAPQGETSATYRYFLSATESNRRDLLQSVKTEILKTLNLTAQTRVLVCNADNGLLLWEINRLTPEALTVALVKNERSKKILTQYAACLEEFNQPVIETAGSEDFSDYEFDAATAWFPPAKISDIQAVLEYISSYAGKDIPVVLGLQNAGTGLRLSKILQDYMESPKQKTGRQKRNAAGAETETAQAISNFAQWEQEFFTQNFCADKALLIKAAEEAGFKITVRSIKAVERRLLTEAEITGWLSSDSLYGKQLNEHCTPGELQIIRSLLTEAVQSHSPAEYQVELWVAATA